ncbi:MAG: hypothetical protein PHC62_09615 [Candidatus Izemoplasmatales bacterium]|nr:hypothetical protein [Candidatus Izemoplasmatales bacterium]
MFEELQMTQEEMISALDTAGGMLMVKALRDPEIMKARELVEKVSIALGEVEEIKYVNYNDLENEDEE